MQAKALNYQNDGTTLDPVEKAVEPGLYLSCLPLAGTSGTRSVLSVA